MGHCAALTDLSWCRPEPGLITQTHCLKPLCGVVQSTGPVGSSVCLRSFYKMRVSLNLLGFTDKMEALVTVSLNSPPGHCRLPPPPWLSHSVTTTLLITKKQENESAGPSCPAERDWQGQRGHRKFASSVKITFLFTTALALHVRRLCPCSSCPEFKSNLFPFAAYHSSLILFPVNLKQPCQIKPQKAKTIRK